MRIPNWAVAFVLALVPAIAAAQNHQHPTLHINPRWRECSFQLSSALTKDSWRQFTREAGVVTYFRPLTDARPMGKRNYEVSLLQWETAIDDHEDAWNDTFVHPDSVHWLLEGSGLKFPGLTARVGITDKMDAGFYLTKAPGANYGFYGAQVQRSLIDDTERNWAAAARASFVKMYGPEDLDFTVYGLDLVASTRWRFVSPYAGVSASLSRSHEKSSVVNLADANVLGAQGTVGAAMQLGRMKVSAEYAIGAVQATSLKIGFGSGGQ
jgi:hypothetical protein